MWRLRTCTSPRPVPQAPGGGAAGLAAAGTAACRGGIEPVQFALAGMNAHINHDLPLAMVSTCTALGTAPDVGRIR
jgi:hypothetical protein